MSQLCFEPFLAFNGVAPSRGGIARHLKLVTKPCKPSGLRAWDLEFLKIGFPYLDAQQVCGSKFVIKVHEAFRMCQLGYTFSYW